ncbi:MAG: hypothetical protein SGI74_03260 [Oligoflexia bacterium]|nr:hypothetical protein [Oligoflexia bacterium]
MKKLVFVLIFIFSTSAFSYQTLPAIQIKNLNEFAGSYLTVFYVSGSMGSMGLDFPGQKPKINTILPIVTKGATESQNIEIPLRRYLIKAEGEINIPKAYIQKIGIRAATLIIFVIHKQDEVFLRNTSKEFADRIVGEKGDTRLLDDRTTIKKTNKTLETGNIQFQCIQTYSTWNLGAQVNEKSVLPMNFDSKQCLK